MTTVQAWCITGRQHKRRVWVFVRNIVNLYRGMSKLKLKINVTLPQLLCIAVSVALNGEFGRLGGFCVDCYYLRKTEEIAHQIRHLGPQKRQYTTTEIGLHLF